MLFRSQIISRHKSLLILERIAQPVFVVYRTNFLDVVCRHRLAHGAHVNVCGIARHVNGDDAQAARFIRLAPLADLRQILFADAAAQRPEMHERQLGRRFGKHFINVAVDPLGRAVKGRIGVLILIGIVSPSF